MLTSNDLYNIQEKADTKMFLHEFYAASNGHRSIAIGSSDVEVLAYYHQVAIPTSVTLVSGTSTRSRLIDIRSTLRQAWCCSMPSSPKRSFYDYL